MSYLVLARKSRPQTFAEVVGQKAVVRTLQNALSQGRVAHALMFSGVRGTGKTTLARIMAKALNCEQGPAPEPCNCCRSCREIAEGFSIDLQEVDGASNRGIQEIRELKEKIRFMPTSSRYKIILIDEVHMLTTEAFNALLKTLEEPPEHVYFMFATTEPHKVPITILSRCQRYELKRLNRGELADHFSRLAREEGVQMEPAAVEMIVRECGGSVRDGLSLLDQVFSYCGSEVRAAEVVEVLGLVSHQAVADVGTALLQGDLAAVYTLLDRIYLQGIDIKRFGNDLLSWFRALVLCKVSGTPEAFLEESEDALAVLQHTAAGHSLETLTALFNLLLEGLEQVLASQQPRMALEMTCIRAMQFRQVVPVSELIGRLDRLLAGAPLPSPPAPSPAPPQSRPSAPSVPAASAPPQAPPRSVPSPAEQRADRGQPPLEPSTPAPAPTLKSVAAEPQPAIPPPEAAPQPAAKQEPGPAPSSPAPPGAAPTPPTATAAPAATAPLSGDQRKRIRQHWDIFLKYVRERQPWIAAALQMASSVERKGDDLIVHFEDSADCTLLKQRPNITALTEFVLDFFQENLRIQFTLPGSDACAVDPGNGLAPQQERRALANDPLVLTALDVFTGQVGDIRIGSRYRSQTSSGPGATEEAQAGSEE